MMAKKDRAKKDRREVVEEVAEEPTPEPQRMPFSALVAGGYVLATRKDERFTYVLTHGGVKLKFPGDEEKAATLTKRQLTGVSDAAPLRNVRAAALGRK